MCLKGPDCLENYELDPAWYLIAPGLAWDAAFKVINVELELLKDPQMLMIEKGIRGGISLISNRFARANDKYMCEAYDETKPTKYIIELNTTLPANAKNEFQADEQLLFSEILWKTPGIE